MRSARLAARHWPVSDPFGALSRIALYERQRTVDPDNPDAMIVFNIDLGHTDPQWVIPYGGTLTIDGPARTVTAHYQPG